MVIKSHGIHNSKRAAMAPLDWKDVNLDWKVITFPRSKAGNGSKVPLNETAIAALKIRKPSGLKLRSSRRWFENCLADAHIEDFYWHDLRRTFASRLHRNKVALEDIRVLLGHSAKSITERYAHEDMDSLREAVAKLVRKTETQTRTNTDTGTIVEFPSAQAV